MASAPPPRPEPGREGATALSPLNLRLALACLGVALFLGAAVLAWLLRDRLPGGSLAAAVLLVLTAGAVANVAVLAARRRRRAAQERSRQGRETRHSLFE